MRRLIFPHASVTLLYTSGTTGAPKGVMSTHVGIINTTLASAENQRLTEKDRLCLSVPLAHMFGCICVTLAMTPLGKIQKFKMREIAIKEYGLE